MMANDGQTIIDGRQLKSLPQGARGNTGEKSTGALPSFVPLFVPHFVPPFHISPSATRIWKSFFHVQLDGGRMVRFKVNGKEQMFDGDPEMPLLWYLRDVAALTGTKFGCGMELCGACTGHQNGSAIRSCTKALSEKIIKSRAIRTLTRPCRATSAVAARTSAFARRFIRRRRRRHEDRKCK